MTSNTHKLTITMTALIGLTLGLAAPAAPAQPGCVLSHQKISDTEGNFTGTLDNDDGFGGSAASLGDLDGDGVGDLAVGATHDDDGGADRGAVWVLFLNTNTHQKISDTEGGFTGILDNEDRFGASLASLGDHDGDGVTDLAVGAIFDDDGGVDRGAVWVLFLDGVPACPADVNDDEVVDIDDLFQVLGA
ncbi:MAG: FG-GAP repeat protein, partial [Phycisphaerales bacterium]